MSTSYFQGRTPTYQPSIESAAMQSLGQSNTEIQINGLMSSAGGTTEFIEASTAACAGSPPSALRRPSALMSPYPGLKSALSTKSTSRVFFDDTASLSTGNIGFAHNHLLSVPLLLCLSIRIFVQFQCRRLCHLKLKVFLEKCSMYEMKS